MLAAGERKRLAAYVMQPLQPMKNNRQVGSQARQFLDPGLDSHCLLCSDSPPSMRE